MGRQRVTHTKKQRRANMMENFLAHTHTQCVRERETKKGGARGGEGERLREREIGESERERERERKQRKSEGRQSVTHSKRKGKQTRITDLLMSSESMAAV